MVIMHNEVFIRIIKFMGPGARARSSWADIKNVCLSSLIFTFPLNFTNHPWTKRIQFHLDEDLINGL